MVIVLKFRKILVIWQEVWGTFVLHLRKVVSQIKNVVHGLEIEALLHFRKGRVDQMGRRRHKD